MSNNQLYPFERNRYYRGKELASADFQAEQNYSINKARFMNSLMYGSGIVCGCGVFSLDDLSILVESGVAIDGTGREIVIESSVVKKLSSIEGYDKLKSTMASLLIKFKETNVHPVYSVNRDDNGEEYEYNRIKEGYELYLVDSEDYEEGYDVETEFLSRENIFTGNDFIGDIIVPNTACKGRNYKITLEIKKISKADSKLSCHAVLEVPAFFTAKGEKELEINVDDLVLAEGEVYTKEFWVKLDKTDSINSEIILKSGSATAFESDKAINAAASFSIKIRLTNASPVELVNRATAIMNLEMRNIGATDAIKLADIKLVRSEGTYIIEGISEIGIKKYISAPSQELLKSRYLEYFVKDVDIEEKKVQVDDGAKNMRPVSGGADLSKSFATGVLEIPLGKNARAGDIRYSGEIAHGLGKGNVYVSIGYEYISSDKALGANARNTIYGNPELFSKQSGQAVDAETAVRVLNDKGSFVVAAKLLRDVDYLVLQYRWVAIKFASGDDTDAVDYFYDKSITAETPTVVMGPKENHFFGVRFNNMKNCSITYELTAPASGEITADGIYTSPTKEGVYEIRIYCTDMPVVCTYAYAIVKKNVDDNAPDGDSSNSSSNTLGATLNDLKMDIPDLKMK
ncbi:MAG: hypothetical protein K6B41_07910 [Butyrivibrio sp.]|nr:hypothetical protein [Butyrivibrio sp.]